MLNVGLTILDALGVTLLSCGTALQGQNFRDLPPEGRIVCRIGRLPLIPGTYSAHVSLKDEASQADYVYHALRFVVVNHGESDIVDHAGPREGSVAVSPEWRLTDPAGAGNTQLSSAHSETSR